MGRSIFSLGDAASRRAAGLDRLERLPARNPAADVVDDFSQGDAHRDFDEAGVVDFADEGEDLGALAGLGPDAGIPLGAPVDDGRDVGPGLDVVDAGGLPPEAALGGIGRSRPRLAEPSLDRSDERRLLAADERPRSALDLDIEIEAGAQDILSEKTVIPGLLQSDAQPLDGQGVFIPDVDKSGCRPDRLGPDDHAFNDRVRDRPRECSGP